MTFHPVGVISDPSLLPQTEFHLLSMEVCMVPGTAALLLYLNAVHTTLGRGAVGSILQMRKGIAREDK